jgi:hypothetical protein
MVGIFEEDQFSCWCHRVMRLAMSTRINGTNKIINKDHNVFNKKDNLQS